MNLCPIPALYQMGKCSIKTYNKKILLIKPSFSLECYFIGINSNLYYHQHFHIIHLMFVQENNNFNTPKFLVINILLKLYTFLLFIIHNHKTNTGVTLSITKRALQFQ